MSNEWWDAPLDKQWWDAALDKQSKEIKQYKQRIAELEKELDNASTAFAEQFKATVKANEQLAEARKDAERWQGLIALACDFKIDLWIYSPAERLQLKLTEDGLFKTELFDRLLKENAAMSEKEGVSNEGKSTN